MLSQLFAGEPSTIGRWLGKDFAHHVKSVVFLNKPTDLAPLLNFHELDFLRFNAGLKNKDEWRTVCRLSSLKRLAIDSVVNKGIVPSRGSVKARTELNDLAPLLDNLHQLENLGFFSLNCQGIPPALLRPIFNLPELEEIHLHLFGRENESNGRDDRFGSENVEFSKSPGISRLHLVLPAFDSESLKGLFRAVPRLNQLCIHSTIAGEEKPSFDVLDELSELSQLEEIYFFAVEIGKVPDSWARLPLKRLGIGFCHLGDEGLHAIELMSQLEYLQLNHTGLTDKGLEPTLKINNLKELSIIDTRVTDHGLRRLTELKSLEIIHIRDTLVTKEGVGSFRKLNPACELVE